MAEQKIVTTFNAVTGEVEQRPYTTEELEREKAAQAEVLRQNAELEARLSARQSALAKLAALGLTEDEIATF